ncbi:MAG: hypothetical protein D6746_03115 [Bacteroidetes bacterium]|nr:MAG: hypothetical protein D6746_03115 [Bacteroidota bacterium]
MPYTFLLLVTASFLLAWEASGRTRRPLVAAFSLLLFGGALVGHLVAGDSLLASVTGLAAEVGLGLLLAAGVMALRRAAATPFLLAGLLALAVAGILYGSRLLLGRTLATGEASLLLELGPDDDITEVQPLLSRFGARYERAFPSITPEADEDLAQTYLVFVSARHLDRLMEALRTDRENVDYVELNAQVRLTPPRAGATPAHDGPPVLEDDPLVDQQWALDAIGAHEAHALLVDRQPVRRARIAIVDTGVDGGHEDLQGVFHPSPAARDGHGHGTHCAGLAGAVTNNGLGMASLNWEGRFVEVAGYQALNDAGLGTLESIAQAILDATGDGADVISMSLGLRAPTPPRVLAEAIDYARRRGVIVVASAGNANEDARLHAPSNVEGVLVIAAVDAHLRKAGFSNTNTRLERPLAAPGVNILSLQPGGSYVAMSGTSMATPIVAGLIGVLRALAPELSDADVYALLHETGSDGPDTDRVGRLIDAGAAIRAVLAPSPAPAAPAPAP